MTVFGISRLKRISQALAESVCCIFIQQLIDFSYALAMLRLFFSVLRIETCDKYPIA